jgi:hypothetical protein
MEPGGEIYERAGVGRARAFREKGGGWWAEVKKERRTEPSYRSTPRCPARARGKWIQSDTGAFQTNSDA